MYICGSRHQISDPIELELLSSRCELPGMGIQKELRSCARTIAPKLFAISNVGCPSVYCDYLFLLLVDG